jgi:hypothetical protein
MRGVFLDLCQRLLRCGSRLKRRTNGGSRPTRRMASSKIFIAIEGDGAAPPPADAHCDNTCIIGGGGSIPIRLSTLFVGTCMFLIIDSKWESTVTYKVIALKAKSTECGIHRYRWGKRSANSRYADNRGSNARARSRAHGSAPGRRMESEIRKQLRFNDDLPDEKSLMGIEPDSGGRTLRAKSGWARF